MKRKSVAGTIFAALAGVVAGGAVIGKLEGKVVDQKTEKVDKFKGYYNMLNQWLILKQEGKSLEKFFVNNGYKTIAIYGMGEMGNRLYDELKNSSIEVKYAIDKDANSIYSDLEVKELGDDMEKVDVVVITAIFAYEDIIKDIGDKFECTMISLEDVVYEI